jgi:archaellum component FlaF (FlaF/FlaG flagellin family)
MSGLLFLTFTCLSLVVSGTLLCESREAALDYVHHLCDSDAAMTFLKSRIGVSAFDDLVTDRLHLVRSLSDATHAQSTLQMTGDDDARRFFWKKAWRSTLGVILYNDLPDVSVESLPFVASTLNITTMSCGSLGASVADVEIPYDGLMFMYILAQHQTVVSKTMASCPHANQVPLLQEDGVVLCACADGSQLCIVTDTANTMLITAVVVSFIVLFIVLLYVTLVFGSVRTARNLLLKHVYNNNNRDRRMMTPENDQMIPLDPM